VKNERTKNVFKIINGDLRIDVISERYLVRKHIQNTPHTRTTIAALFRHACLDFLRHGHKNGADSYRQRAEILEQALGVLGITGRLTGAFVLDKMKSSEFEALDKHFISLMSSGDGGACSIRAVTALAQMAMDLRRTATSYERHSGNVAFFFMLGSRFSEARQAIPSAGEAVDVYRLLVEAISSVDSGGAARLADQDARTNGSAIRTAMRAGGKAR